MKRLASVFFCIYLSFCLWGQNEIDQRDITSTNKVVTIVIDHSDPSERLVKVIMEEEGLKSIIEWNDNGEITSEALQQLKKFGIDRALIDNVENQTKKSPDHPNLEAREENENLTTIQHQEKKGVLKSSTETSLYIEGSNADILFENGAGSHMIWKEGTEFSKAWVGYNGNDINIDNFETGGDIYIDAADEIRFQSDNSTKMIITNEGRIGIGTTSPNADFHLNGDIKIGETGSVFAEIRIMQGTFPSGDNFHGFTLPDGFNDINTRVLSFEVHNNNSIWIGQASSSDAGDMYYYMDGTTITLHVPDLPAYRGKPFRLILMRF